MPVLPELVDAYNLIEVTKVFICEHSAAAPGFANLQAPTLDELNAALEVSQQVADWAGWTVTSAKIERPNIGNKFVGKIGGRINAEDSTITFDASRTGEDIRQVQFLGWSGIVAIADGGAEVGNLVDLYTVTVDSVGKVRAIDGNNRLTVSYSINTKPIEDVTIVAGV